MRNNLFNLKDKTCIITGGAGLIGKDLVRVCREQGGNVIIADINEQEGKKLEGGKVRFQKCDITKVKDVKNLIAST